MTSISSQLATLIANSENMTDDIDEIKENLQKQYVTKDQFDPVRNLVYGVVALLLTGFMGTLVTIVFKSQK